MTTEENKTIPKLILTKKQEIAVSKIQRWLRIPIDSRDISTRIFLLTGKAGTGKTTAIKYALAKILEADLLRLEKIPQFQYMMNGGMFGVPNVVGIAMSHKAKNILNGSLPICHTYAKFYGLNVAYKDDGSIIFEENKKAKKEAYCALPIKCLVFDECSNINLEMQNILFNYTNPSTKIILMGDRGQNPPITSSKDKSPETDADSPVFNLVLSEDSTEELDERVRQTEGNPIIDMSDIIYEEIFGGQSLTKVKRAFRNESLVDGIGFNTIDYNEVLPDFKDASTNYLDTKVICYKNIPVNNWNYGIRSYIHQATNEIFVPKDIIYMNNTYVHHPDGEEKIEGGTRWTCYNSDEYMITDVRIGVYMDVECFILYVDKEGHKHLEHTNAPYIRVVSPAGTKAYYKVKSIKYKHAQMAPNFTPDDKKIRSMLFKEYYNYVESFGYVSYAFGFTGHKIQGSTYKNIYIDVNDILDTKPISKKRKLQALYTAVTRASHSVKLITLQKKWKDYQK